LSASGFAEQPLEQPHWQAFSIFIDNKNMTASRSWAVARRINSAGRVNIIWGE
jgi:hypothetical protein